MKIFCDDFSEGVPISPIFTCEGKDKMPSIRFFEVPDNTLSLSLIVEDPDAPNGDFVHLILINIPGDCAEISEGKIPKGAIFLKNDFGVNGYKGPCPPSGVHRYFFKLFALDIPLALDANAGKKEFREAILGHILEKSSFFGLYSRQ
ncbi:MAG: YbhB/YbcL family Raf kinase inhibitor-like protein [Candidatus Gracilibacteria bacterium]|jgi:Raf kinase inhibitor-like YbhB/YbcL family protein|nr:YbhB/YbcL family Raf kinase inhibitor-like protein [Candidatus Gracilibacteria bacterium]